MTSPLKMKDIKEMENLQKFFQTVVLCPWTKQLVYQKTIKSIIPETFD